MNYQTLSIEDIINWCKENNQVAWLKAKVKEQTNYKVFPKIKVKDENGKVKTVSDKSAQPIIEKRLISFIQIKRDFAAQFMPEILPKAQNKKKTMYELIAEL